MKRKNNNIVLLDKLIDDTKNNIIVWENLKSKSNSQWDLYSYVGKKNITNNKYITFILIHGYYQGDAGQISVFLCNSKLKSKDLIFKLNPGFFSFKQKKLVEDLLVLVSDKIYRKKNYNPTGFFGKEVKSKNIDKTSEDIEPIKKVWDDEDIKDDIEGIPV